MNLRPARREVARLSDRALERETAYKWAARSIACYERAIAASSATEQAKWGSRAFDYRHEALEHAALIGDHGRTVGKIEREIERAAKKSPRRKRKP